MNDVAKQLTLFDPDICSGKTSPALSPPEPLPERTSAPYWKKSAASMTQPLQSLDLSPGAGNLLGESYWQTLSPWHGASWTLNTGASPIMWKEIASNPVPRNGVGASFLSQILRPQAPRKYYLTALACQGILRRAAERGKELPGKLRLALEAQAGLRPPPAEIGAEIKSYHINQRDEGIDLGHLSGALMATSNMQMQTFVAFADDKTSTLPDENGCLTPWDVQSRRIFNDSAAWPALYGGEGGGHGYVQSIAFAMNERDELRDLHDIAAAICAQPGLKQQTYVAGLVSKGNGDCFLMPEQHTSLSGGGGQAGQGYPCVFTAGFNAGAGPSAGNIGYEEEIAPTLKGSPSGNMMPTILALNDQGGQRMDVSEDIVGTLRADMGGHQPLVLSQDEQGVYCIMGNAIDRQPHNGGNGIGVSDDGVCYTITATDRHSICEPYQEIVGTLNATDYKGINNQYVDGDKCVVESAMLIRRLMPVECELLQGFPQDWTDIPGASDTARYKACGNSICVPCVEFIMGGIVLNLILEKQKGEGKCTDTPTI